MAVASASDSAQSMIASVAFIRSNKKLITTRGKSL